MIKKVTIDCKVKTHIVVRPNLKLKAGRQNPKPGNETLNGALAKRLSLRVYGSSCQKYELATEQFLAAAATMFSISPGSRF